MIRTIKNLKIVTKMVRQSPMKITKLNKLTNQSASILKASCITVSLSELIATSS